MNIIQQLTAKSAFHSDSSAQKDMPISTVCGHRSACCAAAIFVSVTYGRRRQPQYWTSSRVDSMGLNAIAHLTCVGADHHDFGHTGHAGIKGVECAGAARRRSEGMDRDAAFTHYRAADLIAESRSAGFIVAAPHNRRHV